MDEPIAPSTAAASPPTQATTPTPAPPVAPVAEPHSHHGVISPEATKMAQWTREDLARGKVTPEAAAKIFDELGIPEDQRVMPADSRTDEQKLIDDHFPAAKENDYLIQYYPPGQEPPVMPKELTELDQSARTWLSAAEFPRELGNSLVTIIAEVGRTTKGMTPNQLEAYGEAEFSKLQRAYGPQLEEKLLAANRMVQALEAKRPGLNTLLKSKGIGDSALVASQLIAQSDRYWGRRKGR